MVFIPTIKSAFHRLRFQWAARNDWTYQLYLNFLHRARAGSIDAVIDSWSRSKQGFTVLQVGANDGFTHDPVQKWAKRDHWHGVLLEPQPYVVRQTRLMYASLPSIEVINAALGPQDGSTKLYKISFSNERWATGLSRFDRASLEQLIEQGRLDKRIRKNGAHPPDDRSRWIESIDVPVVSFHSLLLKHPMLQHTDLLMVDTEGFDAEVIRLFPFEQVMPALVVFEDMHLNSSDLKHAHERLNRFGYSIQRNGPNTIAWQAQLNDLLERMLYSGS